MALDLINNPMFQQFLSAAGGAMDPKGLAGGLDRVNQQQISTKNFAQMLSQILGNAPTGFKMSGDKDNFKINVPTAALGEGGFAGVGIGNPGSYGGETGKPAGDTTTVQPYGPGGGGGGEGGGSNNNMMAQLLGFTASSPGNFSGADLAGLTVQDLTQALTGAIAVDSLAQRGNIAAGQLGMRGAEITQRGETAEGQLGATERRTDIMAEATAQRATSDAEAAKINQRKVELLEKSERKLDETFVGGMSLRKFNSLSSTGKEYSLAKAAAGMVGDEIFMPLKEYKELPRSSQLQLLEGLRDDPELMKIATDLAKAKQAPKLPTEMTWQNSWKNLQGLFGDFNRYDQWTATPRDRAAFSRARLYWNEYKDKGYSPAKALEMAQIKGKQDRAAAEKEYHSLIKRAGDNEVAINKIRVQTKKQLGYIPGE